MTKNKKPTMAEVKNVINNLIQRLTYTQNNVRELNYLFDTFVEFNSNTEQFEKFLKEKIEKDKIKAEKIKAEKSKEKKDD